MTSKQDTTLEVRGMTCGACVRHVKQALTDVDGVEGVEVQLRQGRVVITHEPSAAPVALLAYPESTL